MIKYTVRFTSADFIDGHDEEVKTFDTLADAKKHLAMCNKYKQKGERYFIEKAEYIPIEIGKPIDWSAYRKGKR